MLVLRFLFRSLILGAVTRLLGGFFPIGRRLLRLIWR
jgi:hypothetical protein